MMNYRSVCYLLLTIINTVHISHQACPSGWVGSACNMLCNCQGKCYWNGNCYTSGLCKFHFFGPGCQYVDILSWDFTPDVPEYVRDGDMTTCNPDSGAFSVEVNLAKPIPLSWFSIYIKDPAKINNFTVKVNSQDACWNEKRFRLDRKTIYVMCDNRVLLTSLHIYGAASPSVCTININGGRLLSLKQKTTQSTTFVLGSVIYESSRAVDNDGITCSITKTDPKGPEWRITFSMPARLTFIDIIKSDIVSYRLNGARISMYSNQGTTLISTFLNGTFRSERVFPQTTAPISKIVLKQSLKIPLTRLAVCEFSAYGDSVCPDLMYGLECNNKCNCTETEECNDITGGCTRGCSPGFYGFNCTSHCSPFCEHVTCHYYYGSCHPCRHGYFGTNCDIECLPGTYGAALPCRNCSVGCIDTCDRTNGTCACKNKYYGPRCDECVTGTYGASLPCENCSIGCIDTCNAVNGTCACKSTYYGPRCDECSQGLHGALCDKTCSEFCQDNVCDMFSGKCVLCIENRTGHFCEECPQGWHGTFCNTSCSEFCHDNMCDMFSGDCTLCIEDRIGRFCEDCKATFYGDNCNQTCPEHCLNGICDQTYGTCHLCNEGYQGKMCLRAMPESTWLWLMLLMCVPVLVLSFACKRKKQDSAEALQEELETYSPPTMTIADTRKQSTTLV